MKLTELRLKAFRGISDEFKVPIGGHNALIFGENGASKSSIARALELLFDPRPDSDLLAHKNLFGASDPSIAAEFKGHITNTNPQTGQKFRKAKEWPPLEWTVGKAKPLPSWLLSSAARSAFLDHRKLLLLSDCTRELSENFFRTAVHHLFANLPAGNSGKTVGQLWEEVSDLAFIYRQAQQGKGKEAESGVSDPVARHKAIEDGLNLLNQALNDYLLPLGGKPPRLVTEAERLLRYFENLRLTLSLNFENLTFNRTAGTFDGGRLHPEVKYCGKELTRDALNERGENQTFAVHHEILNEARLTALALALFFAAVRLQDEVEYIPGKGDPEKPARLLVLDDVLVGLDYDHRIPVLTMLRKEFLKASRFQVVLLTHNREWFDFCRLKVGARGWNFIEIYAQREGGPQRSDWPVQKEGSSDLLDRAKAFLDDAAHKEIPAAANYARTSIEWALKELCALLHCPIAFTLEPHRLTTEVFLTALTKHPGGKKGAQKAIRKELQTELEALRRTVLNAYSHWHPTTAVESEVKRAIAVAEKLKEIMRSRS
jgi:hypothetical protein